MQGFWQTSKRTIAYHDKTLIMGILNATPDSFSDGGKFFSVDEALRQTEKMILEGADIIDVGGESTRPAKNRQRISVEEEKMRVVPLIEAIAKRFDCAISVDTCKSEVAEEAINVGAEIINDISGLTFDEKIGEIASRYKTGLVLMHLRGDFETMHQQEPVADILSEVIESFESIMNKAFKFGIKKEAIVFDVGIGFSKTFEQNLELIAKLQIISDKFAEFPLLIGASRKSFIGKVLEEENPLKRLHGSLASVVIAVWNGAKIVRVHDVKETVETLKLVEAFKNRK